MYALSQDTKITLVKAASAAGSTDINGTGVDMSGWEGVLFLTTVGTITANAVTSLKAQQSDDDGSSDGYSDLEGTGITIADDDDGQSFYLDIIQPQKRYVRPVLARATQNAVVGEIYAIRYRNRGSVGLPITNTVADTMTGEVHVSPDEGTA